MKYSLAQGNEKGNYVNLPQPISVNCTVMCGFYILESILAGLVSVFRLYLCSWGSIRQFSTFKFALSNASYYFCVFVASKY